MPPVRQAARADTTALDTAALDVTALDATALDVTALNATAVDANGLPRSVAQPVRSMIFGPHGSPSGHPRRSEAEPTRVTSHPRQNAHRSGEVDHGPGRSTGAAPARPTAERIAGGRDGFRGDGDGPQWPGKDQRGRRDSAPRTARSARVDAASAGAASYGGLAWSDRGRVDASWTGSPATGGGETPTIDVTRVVDGGPWLALPGEPAAPARLDSGPDGAGGGRATGIDPPSPLVAARAADPWPALPDDSALWSVAGPALDTAQLTRLDREQGGD